MVVWGAASLWHGATLELPLIVSPHRRPSHAHQLTLGRAYSAVGFTLQDRPPQPFRRLTASPSCFLSSRSCSITFGQLEEYDAHIVSRLETLLICCTMKPATQGSVQ